MGAIWLLLLSLASGRDGLIGAAGTHLPARSSCLAFAPSLAGAGSRPLLRCGTLLAASARSVPAWEGAAVQRLLVKGVRDNFSPQRPSTASAVRPEPVPVSALIMSVFKNPAASLYDEPWVSFKGVSRTPSGKFAAGIWIGGEAKHLGTYEHQQDAARVYDSAVMEHRPRWCDEDLNFPAASREERENAHLRRFQRVSSFKGVSRAPSGKWQVQISVGGTTQYRGYYQDERDAVLAYDSAVLTHRPHWSNEDLNFPDASPKERAAALSRRFQRPGHSSAFKGVTRTPGDKWKVQVRIRGTTRRLGVYEDERDAALAYDSCFIEHHPTWCYADLNLPDASSEERAAALCNRRERVRKASSAAPPPADSSVDSEQPE